MIAFLNDRSFELHNDWAVALVSFLKAAYKLSVTNVILLRDSNFFLQPVFLERFHSIALPKDQRALILELVFSERHYKCWRPNRVSNAIDEYSCSAPPLNLRDESLSEAAERMLQNGAITVSV